MSISALSGIRKVFVGEDELEFSRGLIRFDVSEIKRDRTGLFLYDGEIELGLVDGLPESIDPRKNPQRWARGTQIRIEERKTDGSFATHPLGALTLLNAPAAIDLVEPRLVLGVGCVLSYRVSQTALTIIKAGGLDTETTRTALIEQVLTAALIPNWVGEIPQFPFQGSISIDSDQNPVEVAGLIAYAAGFGLWQNNQREIEAVPLAVDANTPATLVVSVVPDPSAATEAIAYEPAPGEEVVIEEFSAKADKSPKPPTANYDTQTSVLEEFGDAKAIDQSKSGKVLLKRTVIQDKQSATSKEKTITVEQAEGLILGNKKFGLQPAEITSEKWRYEGTAEGKLLKIEKTVQQAFAIAVRTFFDGIKNLDIVKNGTYAVSPLQPVTGLYSLTDYLYNESTQVVREIRSLVQQPRAAIAAEEHIEAVSQNLLTGLQPTKPEISELSSLRYTEIRPNEWQKLDIKQSAFGDASEFAPDSGVELVDRIAYKLVLGNSTNLEETSRAGGTQPPSTERRPAPTTPDEQEPEPVRSTLRSATTPQDTKRSQPLEVQYVSALDQLKPLTENENKILYGRRLGQRFQVPLIDVLIDNGRPGQVWHFVEPDGTKQIYLVDALTYTHDLESSAVSAEGIWLGTIGPNSETPTLPYQIVKDCLSGWKWGSSSRVYPYSLTTEPITTNSGWKWGNSIRRANSSPFRNGWKWGSFSSRPRVTSYDGWKWGNKFELLAPEESTYDHIWTFESPSYLNDKVASSHLTSDRGSASQVTGIWGNGLRILYDDSGSGSYDGWVSTERTSTLNFASTSFVISAWLKYEDFNAFGAFVGVITTDGTFASTSDQEFALAHDTTDGAPFLAAVSSVGSFSFFPNAEAATSWSLGDWIHLLFENDLTGNTAKFTLYNQTTEEEVIRTGDALDIPARTDLNFVIYTSYDSVFDSIHFARGVGSVSSAQKLELRSGEYPFS